MSDASAKQDGQGNRLLFWGCFMALIATSTGFIVRALVIGDWQTEFGLTQTQMGELLGVGLWPFAISIVLFSLVIDKIGYGRAMVFAFACHIVSAIVTIFAQGYWWLYWGTFIVALGNGTVEALINPVVATMFRENKTKWLNILHAGWPGGLVIGGLLALLLGPEISWKIKVGLIFIPTILYGLMLLGRKFPIHERVESGVTYMSMLQEVGVAGAFIVVGLITLEVGRVFSIPGIAQLIIVIVLTVGYGLYVKSFGRLLFIFLLLIMVPLATTELGTDSWVTELMTPEMEALGAQAGWVLVYTSFVMMVLRFLAGPIVHRISPLGLLALSSAIAACGLVFLSKATGISILLAATLYALGKTFFWPTMLGVVAERFPKGGALTLNTIAGVGMLSVGTVGAVFLGNIQDKSIDHGLQAYDQANNTAIHATYVEEKEGIFGTYNALSQDKLKDASEVDQAIVSAETAAAKKGALLTVAIFPCIMLVCFLILIVYFRSKGGYSVVHLDEEAAAGGEA